MRVIPEVPGIVTANQVLATASLHRRPAASERDDPMVPRRPL